MNGVHTAAIIAAVVCLAGAALAAGRASAGATRTEPRPPRPCTDPPTVPARLRGGTAACIPTCRK